MNLLKQNNIESMLISLLKDGEQKTSYLLEAVRKIRTKTTKQGFYAALRRLKKEEAVVTYRGMAALNTTWIKEMTDSFDHINRSYTVSEGSFNALSLADKEGLSYTFSTLKNLDMFWGHSQNILSGSSPIEEHIYAYDPHYWFYIARRKTEKKLLKAIEQSKRKFLMSVGSSTKLDRAIKVDFNGKYLQYNFQKLFPKQNYYVTVIGDFITEVYIDSAVSKKIEYIYQHIDKIDQDLLEQFQSILDSKGKNKIKITRNKSKAAVLKKKMGKNFNIHR